MLEKGFRDFNIQLLTIKNFTEMITEKQKKAVTDLCRYVENYCEENGLEAFMTISASEDHPNGLEQMAGSIVTGRGDHIMGAISGVVKTDKRACMLLSMALMQAQIRKADINVALSGGGNLNMN